MIYFVRHGESEANEKGIFAGQKEDSILNQKGKNQAKDTALIIKNKNLSIDRIISSPLKRTIETSQIIAKEINFDISKIEIDNRITEYDMGSLTGTPIKKISSLVLVDAQNAEDVEMFLERVHECLKEISSSDQNILLVSHAGVGRILEVIKNNINPKLFYDIEAYPNASVHLINWIK